MRTAFLIIVLLHGFIHFIGFVKGFGISEVKELTLPVSRPAGVLWMLAALLIISYGILQFADWEYAWTTGFIAVALSQTLIIIFRKDAIIGTLPNIIILSVLIVSFGNYSFQRLVQSETDAFLSRVRISDERIITENDIQELPPPVKNWIRHSGAVGKPFITSGRIIQQAEMKMKPGQKKWIKATALQYTSIEPSGFIWTVDAGMNSLLHFNGRDKYIDGKAEMLIKLNSLFTVVNEHGEKLNEATLQRYLGEMVWLPSLALSRHISWEQLADTAARALISHKGTTAAGIFYFNPEGDFIRFSALRYMGNDPDAQKFEWTLDVDEYNTFEGISVPSKMRATWKLPEVDWTWLKLEIKDIKYNV